MPDINCGICDTVFFVKPSKIGRSKYCSRRCSAIGRSQTLKEMGHRPPPSKKCPPECTCNKHSSESIQKMVTSRHANGSYQHPKGCQCGSHSKERRNKQSEIRRGKTTNLLGPSAGYFQSKGYIVLTGYQDHPIGNKKTGHLAEHRKVLFDSIGEGSHPCHWCGKLVQWKIDDYNFKLHVDHLNEDKLDNRIENLVPSCFVCNIHRGRKISNATY